MKKLIILNWKNYLSNSEETTHLLNCIKTAPSKCTIVVCPSFIQLESVRRAIGKKKILLGAQDISAVSSGSQTGIISPTELCEIGVEYVIVGHLETRRRGITDDDVIKKTITALVHNLKPVICLSNTEGTSSLVEMREQSMYILHKLKNKGFQAQDFRRCVIAYEPSVYVGSSRPMKVESIQARVLHLRDIVRDIFSDIALKHLNIIYGGAVDDCNVQEIITQGKLQGILVGRAGSNEESIKKLLRTVC